MSSSVYDLKIICGLFYYRYDIMNFQKVVDANGTVKYEYVRVGGWDSGNLTMESNKIFWPNDRHIRGAPVIESVCSKPCPPGEVKVRIVTGSSI